SLEAAVSGTTGLRATLTLGLEAPSATGVDPDERGVWDSHTATAAAQATKVTNSNSKRGTMGGRTVTRMVLRSQSRPIRTQRYGTFTGRMTGRGNNFVAGRCRRANDFVRFESTTVGSCTANDVGPARGLRDRRARFAWCRQTV